MIHVEKTTKKPSDIMEHMLKLFSMFNIRICYDKNDVPDSLGINCIIFNKVVGY